MTSYLMFLVYVLFSYFSLPIHLSSVNVSALCSYKTPQMSTTSYCGGTRTSVPAQCTQSHSSCTYGLPLNLTQRATTSSPLIPSATVHLSFLVLRDKSITLCSPTASTRNTSDATRTWNTRSRNRTTLANNKKSFLFSISKSTYTGEK